MMSLPTQTLHRHLLHIHRLVPSKPTTILHFRHHVPPSLRPSLRISSTHHNLDNPTTHFSLPLSNSESDSDSDISSRLKIAIIGFGNFGQFLAKTLVSQNHTVLTHSRSDHHDAAKKLGVSFFSDPHDLCEEHPDVILLCTSIISTQQVLKSLPFQRLKRNTLFVDVLSVKEFAKTCLLETLPDYFDILCTHPMFGPQSAGESWKGRYFMYERVRIGEGKKRVSRCEKFLNVFSEEGCVMVEMSCEEHDFYAAGSQFMTHTVGRVLETLELESTPINTKGYEALLDLVENTCSDSFDLYYGLFMCNKNALDMLERLDLCFEELKKQLFGSLHEVVRKQLFESPQSGLCAANGSAEGPSHVHFR